MMESMLAELNKISFLSITSEAVSGLKNQRKVCLRPKEIFIRQNFEKYFANFERGSATNN